MPSLLPSRDGRKLGGIHRVMFGIMFIAGAIFAYPLIGLAAGQWKLALCVFAAAMLFALMTYRLIQQRGRAQLSIVVIGLPLLVAISLTSILHLTPFLARQRTIDQLNQAGISYSAKPPKQLGTWMRDDVGNLVPGWMLSLLGANCLSELKSIDTSFHDFQGLRYDDLDLSSLRKIRLHQRHPDTRISVELIDYLNARSPLSIQLTLHDLTDSDADVLGNLEKPFWALINIDENTGDLSKLRSAGGLHLIGDQLSQNQSLQLASLPKLRQLQLDVPKLSAESIEIIQGISDLDWLCLSGARLSTGDLRSVAGMGLNYLALKHATMPKQEELTAIQPSSKVGLLSIDYSQLSVSELRDLVRIFQCESVLLDGPIQDQDVATLFESPCLRNVRVVRPQEIKLYARPNSQSVPR